MALRWFRLSHETSGRDINLPLEVRQRSVQGDTLILIPGTSYEVTEDEWNHIKSAHPDLIQHIHLMR